MICALVDGGGNHCRGDSGGPLVANQQNYGQNYELIGNFIHFSVSHESDVIIFKVLLVGQWDVMQTNLEYMRGILHIKEL